MITDRIGQSDNDDKTQPEKIDKLIEQSKGKRGGYRPGAGRPEGSKNKATLEQQEVKKAFINRVNRNADKLFNAQLDVAVGEKYLMVVTTTGKTRETTVVTDPDTIKRFLDEDEDPNFGEDNEYYFISTKPANNMALDSLLNRSFGKAPERIELEHSGEIGNGETNPELAAEFAEFMKKKG